MHYQPKQSLFSLHFSSRHSPQYTSLSLHDSIMKGRKQRVSGEVRVHHIQVRALGVMRLIEYVYFLQKLHLLFYRSSLSVRLRRMLLVGLLLDSLLRPSSILISISDSLRLMRSIY